MPRPGELYYYPDYVFPDGKDRDKYVLLMGKTRSDDWILVCTTTQPHARPTQPPCYIGYPYPGFFISRANGLLKTDSWLALNRVDEHDAVQFQHAIANKGVARIGELPAPLFCEVLACAVRCPDTSVEQERCMRDLRAALSCP